MAPSTPEEFQRLLLKELKQALQEAKLGRGLGITKVEKAMGNDSGYLSHIVQSRQTVTTEVLYKILLAAQKDPADFFARVFRDAVPPPAVGVLPVRKEKHRRQSKKLPMRKALARWCREVLVDEDAQDDSPGISAIDQAMHRDDHEVAFKSAMAWLRPLTRRAPSVLGPKTAERLCTILLVVAEVLRRQGDRNDAADVIDLAFWIDSRLDKLALRALIYRRGAYLLSDLGDPEMAEYFATQAIKLCDLEDELSGLVHSRYVKALMVDRCGDPKRAVRMLRRCLEELSMTSASPAFAFSVRHLLADRLLGLGDGEAAKAELSRIESSSPESPSFLGRLRSLQGKLASAQGHHGQAEELFNEARELLAASGDALEIALFELNVVLDLLRQRRTGDIAAKAQELAKLAQSFSGSKAMEAAVLEVARHAFDRSLEPRLVLQSIAHLRRHSSSVV